MICRTLTVLLVLALAVVGLGAVGAPATAQPGTAQTSTAQAGGTLPVTRHAGPTRTATAAAIARHTHPDGAAHVLLARADAYGDALAAAPLAAALDAPILLTSADALDPAAAAELARLDPGVVTLLGDLDQSVAAAVTAPTTRRLRGTDDWTTWAAIALEAARLTGADEAVLVEGAHADPQRGWPDALAASALAAARRVPVLLTTAAGLPAATADALRQIAPDRLTVVGGTAAVAEATAQAATTAAGATETTRIAGPGRYDTAALVAQATAPSPAAVWIASGRNWPDALVAGPAAARAGGVLLLADPASLQHAPATAVALDARRAAATPVHLAGGTAALTEALSAEIATGATASHGDVPRPDVDRPPAVPARNTAPPISAARPWSDPATWPSGRVPQAGEVVTIPRDLAVLLDVEPPAVRGIQVDGTLVAADRPMTIRTSWVVVTGHLALGTPEAPLASDVTLVLDPRPGDAIAGAGEGPLAVVGGTLDLHGVTPARPWTRLAATAVAGTSTLSLQRTPGWQVGDRIVIASTSTDPDQAEERTVTAVDGARITLDQPLAHHHTGQTDVLGGREVPQHGEVANLTRSVRVTSSDDAIAARRGGHVMVFHGSVARIGGVELTGLGQAGRVARYPVHFHMMGSASGSWVRGSSVHDTFNRCVTIHGTDDVDVADTIGYESNGHCMFLEDGVERGNTFHCTLALSTRRPPAAEQLLPSDATPASFWITNPDNHWTGNVAAGSDAHGFWFDLPEAPTGLSAGVDMDIRRLPLGHFDHNTAHSGGAQGWKESIGIWVEDLRPPVPAVMRGNVVHDVAGFGAWVEGAQLHDTVLADNGIGFLGLRAALVDAVVVGATASADEDLWRRTGVGFYHQRSEITEVAFVNFGPRRHSWQNPGLAMEAISDAQNDTSVVSGATFTNAVPLRITRPDHPEHGPDRRSTTVRDLDGSISGAPALLTSAAPLLHDGTCPWRADLGAHACPAAWDRAWLILADLGGGDLGATRATRADGVTAPLPGPPWNREQASADVLLGRGYAIDHDGAASGHLEVILYGDAEGHVDLAIPWPHAQAHVYDGWGRWHPVPSGSGPEALAAGRFWLDGTTLHVRHDLDDLAERGTWQRLELCAASYCGAAGPG